MFCLGNGQKYSYSNGYKIYVDIMTGENCRQFKVADMDVIHWPVRISTGMGCGKGVNSGIVILASYKFRFISVHDNLVYDPSNIKSIVTAYIFI